MHNQSESAFSKTLLSVTGPPNQYPQHHPGYQRLVNQSWWCDHCLNDCHDMHNLKVASAGRWYDFFEWLGRLIAQGVAGSLGAILAISAYMLGGAVHRKRPLTAHEAKLERQLNWLMVRRDRLLYGIEKCRSDQGRAMFDDCRPTYGELEDSIERLYIDLAETMGKIQSVERELVDLQLLAQPAQDPNPHDALLR